MESFISKVTFRHGNNDNGSIVAAIGNTNGSSDSVMIDAAETLVKQWADRGMVVTYKITRNYKLNV